jgi:hypothetical protein
MSYRPAAFVSGLWIAAATVALLLALLIWDRARPGRAHQLPRYRAGSVAAAG